MIFAILGFFQLFGWSFGEKIPYNLIRVRSSYSTFFPMAFLTTARPERGDYPVKEAVGKILELTGKKKTMVWMIITDENIPGFHDTVLYYTANLSGGEAKLSFYSRSLPDVSEKEWQKALREYPPTFLLIFDKIPPELKNPEKLVSGKSLELIKKYPMAGDCEIRLYKLLP